MLSCVVYIYNCTSVTPHVVCVYIQQYTHKHAIYFTKEKLNFVMKKLSQVDHTCRLHKTAIIIIIYMYTPHCMQDLLYSP